MTITEQLDNITHIVKAAKTDIEAIHAALQEGFRSLHHRLDYQGVRLERNANQIAARSDWADSQDAWREQIDATLDQQEQTIQELRRRIEILEGKTVQ